MKRIVAHIILVVIMASVIAADCFADVVKQPYRAQIDQNGDTMAVIQLPLAYCFNHKRFRNERHERKYNRMVIDVKKTLPIAKAAREMMVLAYDSIGTFQSKKERKAFFRKMEKNLMKEYKPRLKRLNYRQGKLLVRLIDRECDKKAYVLIKEFMGSTRAFFWNMFGSMFGVSLKTEWDPEGKDKELEDVCIQVEHGLI